MNAMEFRLDLSPFKPACKWNPASFLQQQWASIATGLLLA